MDADLADGPVLAGASVYPNNRPILYTQTAVFNLMLRNKGPTLMVRHIECEFPTDAGMPPHIVRETYNKRIDNGHVEPFQISFTAELHMQNGTQQPKLRLEFEREGTAASRELQAFGSIVIEPLPRRGAHVFISHRDPADRQLARELKTYLSRVGLDAFIAEDLPAPGSKLWVEKLPPAVRASLCVVVLWTKNAVDSEGIKREIQLAEEHGRRVLLAREEGVVLLKDTPRDVEYYPLGASPTRREMATLAQVIWENERRGFYDGSSG